MEAPLGVALDPRTQQLVQLLLVVGSTVGGDLKPVP